MEEIQMKILDKNKGIRKYLWNVINNLFSLKVHYVSIFTM